MNEKKIINDKVNHLEVKNDKEMQNLLKTYGLEEKSLFAALMLSVLVDVLGFTLTLPLLPTIAKEFGAPDIIIGVIISANSLTSLIFGPIWGKLSDKFGRRPILVISQAGTLVAFVLLAASNSVSLVIMARLLDGVFGGQLPIIRAIISDITTPDSRQDKISKVMVGVSLGALLGPVIGGLLGGIQIISWSWRIPPILTAVLSLSSIFITLKVLKETMPKQRRDDLAKAKQELNIAKKSIFSRELVLRLFQIFFFNIIIVLLNSSIAIVVEDRYEGGPTTTGLLMTGLVLLIAFYGIVVFKRVRKRRELKIILPVVIGFGIAAWIYFPFTEHLWMLVIFGVFFAIFMAMGRPIINVNTTRAVDASRQGEVSGFSTAVQSIAETIAPLIATSLLQIGTISIGLLSISPYATLGVTAAFFSVVLMILALVDIRKYPRIFKKQPDMEIDISL